MASKALAYKVEVTRLRAPSEVPKARLCANVVLAFSSSDSEVDTAVSALKAALGSNWSATTALQFMSGRRGEFASQAAAPEERADLFLAHLVAKAVCHDLGLGAVANIQGVDLLKLGELFAASRAYLERQNR